jgi:hypothetical protein
VLVVWKKIAQTVAMRCVRRYTGYRAFSQVEGQENSRTPQL